MITLILVVIAIIFIGFVIPDIFKIYTDMDYIKHLEDMGVFIDEDGHEI